MRRDEVENPTWSKAVRFRYAGRESSESVAARPKDRVKIARAGGKPTRDSTVSRRVFAIPVEERPSTPAGRIADAAYRMFEILVAIVALVLSAPIMLLLSILIRLDSPGPALFFHDRAGRSVPKPGRDLVGRADIEPPPGGFEPDTMYWVPSSFRFVKFRTMYRDALERFPELYWWRYDITPEEFQNYYHNLERDPRLTRFGGVLRKTSLDELPNFWHVLTGQCRLVGPRPEIPMILAYYSAEEMLKFTVKPGLTCLWAIRGRGELSVREKNQFDIEYVRTRTVRLDLEILFRTAWVVLRRRGAF